MTIIDTHTHLYGLVDPTSVLKASGRAGVTDIIVLGVDSGSNRKHLEYLDTLVSGEYPRIHLALGMHPGNIRTIDETNACFVFMREHINRAVAIGEAGLDFWYKEVRKDEKKKQEQRDVFQRHLDLAGEFDLPIVIHSRGAWQECFDMTKKAGLKKVNFHWYSGPLDVLKSILDSGFMVSVSPSIEYSPESRRTAEYVPLDRLLIETDTPAAVHGPDGERIASGPQDVWRTFKALCSIKNVEDHVALAILNANARTFFTV